MMSGQEINAGGKKRRQPVDSAILDAAEQVFGWKGYQQTTMEALAREARISVGTLYNLFKSKEDIYGRVVQRVGEFVVRRIEPLARASDPEAAALDVIRLRLCNYVNDRLFFQPFCFPAYLGLQPEPARLGPEVNRLYQQYVDLVEQIFGRCLEKAGQTGTPGMKMAVCLEGMITAFMGYWSEPLQSDNLAKVARHMKTVLLRGIAPAVDQPESDTVAESRAIYISRYDLERLSELIKVVRAFGKEENQKYADILDDELKHARVTSPREVPPDVVTMNSKVRVANPTTGTDRVYTLVFPRNADSAPENISILSPLGTAVFGRRLGDVFTVDAGEDAQMYEITQMLYQPEASGDYHL
ncbi:MAG: GreA/GreB family elongation factor [Candidatus Hydrogenedentes bacterium]|nr:GreA/GreB family elongation factor [Candidatus Hydrogenedentota bacterium]